MAVKDGSKFPALDLIECSCASLCDTEMENQVRQRERTGGSDTTISSEDDTARAGKRVLDKKGATEGRRPKTSRRPSRADGQRDTGECRDKVLELDVCAICYKAESTNENLVALCSGCNVGFHQRCYNMEHLDDDENIPWFCAYCNVCEQVPEDEEPDSTCVLCGMTGGGLIEHLDHTSQADPRTLRFVHKLCAVAAAQTQGHRHGFVTGSNFQVAVSWDAVGVDNKKRGGEGQGPSSAEKKKAGPPCNVCNRGGGVLVTCEHTGCRTACHPMCGASYCHALSLQVRDEASLPWCVVYYCPSHGSEAPGVPLPNPRFRYLDDKLEIWEAGRVRRAKQQEEDDDDTEDEDEERHTNARGPVALVRIQGNELLALPRAELAKLA